jgi:hypothetical protein
MPAKRKPSEAIRDIIPAICKQRLAKARAMVRQTIGPTLLMSKQEEDAALVNISQDPLTWVMGILTYLDEQDQKKGEADADASEPSIVQL